MKLKEIREDKNGNAVDGEWDSLGDVPFFGEDPYRKKHDENKKERKEHEEQIALRRDKKEKLFEEYLERRDRYEVSKKANEEEAFKFKSEFEKRATGEEDFEEWIARGEEGISKTSVEYEGTEIPVYTLDGHEFLFLVHNIGYRATDTLTTNREAREHSNALIENPSLFETKAKRVNIPSSGKDTYGTGDSANISMSLVSDKVPNEFCGSGTRNNGGSINVVYGFSRIGRRKIIQSNSIDTRTPQGMTSNWRGDSGLIPSIMGIDKLEECGLEHQRKGTSNVTGKYNEVAIDRYEPDSDSPLRPDMIIISKLCLGSVIQDLQLKHAKHFGIPIVILDEQAYMERNRQGISDKAA